jgi:hypothetical protein
MPAKKYKSAIHRRKFISNTVKLAILGSVLPITSCGDKSEKTKKDPGIRENKPPDITKPRGKNTKRKTWSHEGLVMNTKTKVLHFPTNKVYSYYDEIKPGHLQEVGLTAWASQLDGPARLNKDQSGTIVEILAMQDLKQGITDESLKQAVGSISKAFDKECENSKGINSNNYNFRLHELMLQLIALNNTIPASEKWNVFNERTKRPSGLRKRQFWMQNEESFNERVKYILDRREEYVTRLSKRAAKYIIS